MEAALISNINFKSVMKFTIPTIIMMVFMAIYQMVDGVFISNIIGTDSLSAVNIVFPVISLLIGVSIMLGTGGSAVIATNLGEGRIMEAKQRFTFIVAVGIAVGVISGILGFSLAGPFPMSWAQPLPSMITVWITYPYFPLRHPSPYCRCSLPASSPRPESQNWDWLLSWPEEWPM